MNVKVFTGLLCLGLLVLIREGESAAFTGWTVPDFDDATGSGTVTTKLTEGMTAGTSTGITLGVEGGPAHSYEITGQDPANTFTIANSGLITFAVGEVDYETKSSYVITVKVKDEAGSSSGTATVTISVEDKNDNTPSFGGDSFTVTKESAAVDDELLPPLATDKDGTSPSNTITYTFKSPNEMFKFSPSNALQVAKALTANTKYELVIIATDGGTTALASSATVTVCNGMAACKCSAGVPTAVVGMLTMLAAIVASLI